MFLDVSPFCHDWQHLLLSNQCLLLPRVSRQREGNMAALTKTPNGETSKKKKLKGCGRMKK